MNRMPRNFQVAVVLIWLLGTISGLLYAYLNSIPFTTALILLGALLVELSFYVVPGFETVRRKLRLRFSRLQLTAAMVASAVLPYAIYTAPAGRFEWSALALLCILAATLTAWFLVLPHRPVADFLFLIFFATVLLAGVFNGIYPQLAARVPAQVLGQLMWIRVGIFAALEFRKASWTGFGFIPSRRDWIIGIVHCLGFVPVGMALGAALSYARFDPPEAAWWKVAPIALGTFLGMLWVVALSEEFFVRGLLQRWLGEWLKSKWGGLIAASVIFGLAHLPFRGFPNWRFALLAGVAGLFYGHAYMRAGSVRAAMVTHALVNTVWRVLF